MVSDEVDALSGLIGQIYDAAIDPARWSDVLRRSCDFVGGAGGSLYSRSVARKSGVTIFEWNLGTPRGNYFTEYARIDPFAASQPLFGVGEVYSVEDCIPAEEYMQTRVYKEWVKPRGWADYIAANLDKTPTSVSVVGIFRNERQGRADDAMRRRMRLIVPHMRRSAVIGNVLDAGAAQAAVFADTLHGLAAGVFLVGEQGRIEFVNASGQALIDDGKILRDRNGILTALDTGAASMLSDVIARASAGDGAVGTSGIAVPLSSPPDDLFVAHILPLTSGSRRGTGVAYSAVAAIFVRKVSLEPASSIEAISRLYRLTPSEVRVLAAVIEVGGVAAVAEVLGIAGATVKTHLQHLFAKTGTRGQTDLVKLVAAHASPLEKA